MDPSPLNYSQFPTAPRAAARRNRAIAAAAIVFALVATVLFLNSRNDEYNLSMQDLEQAGGFVLPPGTKNIKSHRSYAHGYLVAAKFDIPASQMNAFIASTRYGTYGASLSPTSDVFQQSLGDTWWTPGHPVKCVGENWNGADEQGGLMIDQTNPAVYTVWFVNMMD